MRFIKLAVISLVFFFLLFTLISLFIPSRVRVTREVGINATHEKVSQLLGEPVNWKSWFPVRKSVTDITSENGEVVGIIHDSTQQIVMTEKNDSTVLVSFTGKKGRSAEMGWYIINRPGSPGITVQWWMDFRLRWYPWEKFSSLIFEKQYGTFLELGLERLKKLAENN